MRSCSPRLSYRGMATLAAAAILLLCAALPVRAADTAPPAPADAAGTILGVVPTRGHQNPLVILEARHAIRTNNLTYHGGPVMLTNRTYAIYWVPSGYAVSAGYQSLISGFLQNVAADSGKTTNVYDSDTQYYNSVGTRIGYSSSFGGAYVDTNAFPASGCSDSYTTVCLSDAQIQAEIARVIAANGWTHNASTVFFMFTPKGVGSCAGNSCAFSSYCAYHSWFGSGSTVTLYANMPYAETVDAACGSGQSPNNDDADSTINVLSHEHNEAITDEQGSAWYDRFGNEDGDKCAWNFGSPLGATDSGEYNQVINGGKYYLQQEWSNAHSRCVLQGT